MSDSAGTHSEVSDRDVWACSETAVVDLSVERQWRGRQDDHLHGCQLHQCLRQHRQNMSAEQPRRHLTADDRSLPRSQPLIQPCPGDHLHDIQPEHLQTFCSDAHNNNENNSIGDSDYTFSNKCCPRARTGIPKSHAIWLSRPRVLFRLLGLTACLIMSVGYTECRPLTDADQRYRNLHMSAVVSLDFIPSITECCLHPVSH